jgi:hypothetical protein
LLFRILVVAPEHEPTFFTKIDPLKGPLDAKIKSRSIANIPGKNQIHGRIIDSEGKSLAQAVVSVEVVHVGNLGMGNPPAGTDPLAITDDNGNFALYSVEPFDAMTLKVAARAHAPKRFSSIPGGAKRHEFAVTEGAGIRGRVLRGGMPLKDLSMGTVSVDRTMENFSGDFEIATDEKGMFFFPNLPPNKDYYVYGMVASTQPYGAIPARRVRAGGDGNVLEVGDIEIVPGRRLAGEVRLADGKPLPQPTRLTIGRREAWNSLTIELPPNGHFDATNLPPESLSIGTRVAGYRPSGKNPSLDRLNPFGLVGRLESDKTNLIFLLEPGENLQTEWSNTPSNERPENLPLAGIEAGTRADRVISGRITDAETGRPINGARITPGRPQARRDWIDWLTTRSVVASQNGEYKLEVPPGQSAYKLRVTAEDYLPHLSEEIKPAQESSPLEIKLARGEGPRGTIVNAKGEAVGNLAVYHLGPTEQGSLGANGELRVHRMGEEAKTITDEMGQFKCAAKLGDTELYAANESGFLKLAAKEAKGGKFMLQPWATVKGRLMENGRPAARVNIDLRWQQEFDSARSYINLSGVQTGENGEFEFKKVPPGDLHLTRRETVAPGNGWINIPLKGLTAKPGEVLSLEEVDKAADLRPKAPRFPFSAPPKAL